jgi:hypothetical protein
MTHPSRRSRRLWPVVLAGTAVTVAAVAASCRDNPAATDPSVIAQAPAFSATPAADAALQQRLFKGVPLSGPSQGYLHLDPGNPTPDHRHAGVDYPGTRTVYAPVDGIVRKAQATCGMVILEDARPLSTWPGAAVRPRHVFLHMKDVRVIGREGQTVAAGTELGTSSNVAGGGCVVTGAHLHYEIRREAATAAVGPTSCNGKPGCTTATLTWDPYAFPFPAASGGNPGGGATPRTLTVAVAGSGTVTSAPAGIRCTGGTCSAAFAPGTGVMLSAAPAAGWAFGGWGGACSGSAGCLVQLSGDRSVSATFRPTEVIVDDQGTGFTRGGPAAYWKEARTGYAGHMFWTWSNQSTIDNQASWRPNLSAAGAGEYTVSVYVPGNYATTRSATYTILHNGQTDTRVVNQMSVSNQWVTLGRWYFSANGSEAVSLSDRTGEPNARRTMIGFDAVRWTR